MNILSNLIITEIKSVSTMYSAAGQKNTRKNRPYWAMILKYEGETVYSAGEQTVISNSTHPVILPKGCDYSWQCTRAGHYIIAEFDAPPSAKKIYSFSLLNSEKLLSLMQHAEQLCLLQAPFYKPESLRLLYSALLLLCKKQPYQPADRKAKLLPAVEYIAAHLSEPLTNDTLAATSGLSVVYFRKLFKEVYGCAPIQYVKALRIRKAKEMLASDHGSIGEIAATLGYSSIYDFSRDFKKQVGVAPTLFEKGK